MRRTTAVDRLRTQIWLKTSTESEIKLSANKTTISKLINVNRNLC